MLTLNDTLRPHITKQTNALAAFWTFVVMLAVALFAMIVVAGLIEYVPSIETSPIWEPQFEAAMIFSIIGLFSFLFSWVLLIALIGCRSILRRFKFDGFFPTTLCGAALGYGLSRLLISLTKDDWLAEFINPSIGIHFIIWGAIYGAAYFLFLQWLLKRTANGKLHTLT